MPAGAGQSASPLAAGERPPAAPAAAAAPTGREALPVSGASWTPLAAEPYRGKQDDVYFVTSRTGGYANGAGKIFRTTDGGDTWVKQLDQPGTYFRCLAFLDEMIGFAGNIGPGYFPNVTDEVPLYGTTDGGETWSPVTTIDGPPVVGLCAIHMVRTPFVNAGVLDHRVRLVGVGRVGGPTAMIVSDDLGRSWKRIPLPDSCAMAFDVHFFDELHGVVASATSTAVQDARALILTTSDGGRTWPEAYTGSRPFELTWKISFPTRDVGYVTVQSYDPDPAASQRFVAKSTDGGLTWTEVPLVDDHNVRQFGVAFIDEQRGWVGAMPGGFETADGGRTWMRSDMGNAVNKIRVLREDGAIHLFAIGVKVARLTLPRSAP